MRMYHAYVGKAKVSSINSVLGEEESSNTLCVMLLSLHKYSQVTLGTLICVLSKDQAVPKWLVPLFCCHMSTESFPRSWALAQKWTLPNEPRARPLSSYRCCQGAGFGFSLTDCCFLSFIFWSTRSHVSASSKSPFSMVSSRSSDFYKKKKKILRTWVVCRHHLSSGKPSQYLYLKRNWQSAYGSHLHQYLLGCQHSAHVCWVFRGYALPE